MTAPASIYILALNSIAAIYIHTNIIDLSIARVCRRQVQTWVARLVISGCDFRRRYVLDPGRQRTNAYSAFNNQAD